MELPHIDVSECIENIVIFATGLLFGYHIFYKDGGWWPKKRSESESDEWESDEEVKKTKKKNEKNKHEKKTKKNKNEKKRKTNDKKMKKK